MIQEFRSRLTQLTKKLTSCRRSTCSQRRSSHRTGSSNHWCRSEACVGLRHSWWWCGAYSSHWRLGGTRYGRRQHWSWGLAEIILLRHGLFMRKIYWPLWERASGRSSKTSHSDRWLTSKKATTLGTSRTYSLKIYSISRWHSVKPDFHAFKTCCSWSCCR